MNQLRQHGNDVNDGDTSASSPFAVRETFGSFEYIIRNALRSFDE